MRFRLIATIAALFLLVTSASAGTETTLWSFTNNNGDGAYPSGNGLIADSSGNFFGVTGEGGTEGAGIAFELSPNGNGGYNEIILHQFTVCCSNDGWSPTDRLLLDAAGNLYGTTSEGGSHSEGTVYEISPQVGGGWSETVLYSFGTSGTNDGRNPTAGLIMDASGNLYGTTSAGGTNVYPGTVFELSPDSGGGWTETVLYNFDYTHGAGPYSGVLLDKHGDLFGTTFAGGADSHGTVFELKRAGQTWNEVVLFSFTANGDSSAPVGFIRDKTGNIYGTAAQGGSDDMGTVWELTYSVSRKTYSEHILYSFGGKQNDGTQPAGPPSFGANGAIYGNTQTGGTSQVGVVYKLAQSVKTKKWKETVVFSFDGQEDGANPSGKLILDSSGQIYGMANKGGDHNFGVVYEVTQ